MRTQAVCQCHVVEPLNRCLSGFINRGQHHLVSIIETGTEVIKQAFQPGVAMRLHHCDHPPVRHAASRLQHRRYLNRVMTIIVIDIYAIAGTGQGKAALDTGKPCQAFANCLIADAQIGGDGYCQLS